METNDSKLDNGALLLTKETFNRLLDAIVNHFKTSHGVTTYKDSQLFGFGNYDSEQPNLKNGFDLKNLF